MKKLSFLFLFSLVFSAVIAQYNTQVLQSQWYFRKTGGSEWMPATVPGTVHTDLFANKKIEDPFYRDNEPKLRWIERENWEYKTTFDVNQSVLQKQHVNLQFDGLDTYAEIYLNGKNVLNADNMFRVWKIDAKKIIEIRNQ